MPAPSLESQPILCSAAVALPPTATGEMMYMPGGLQSLTPSQNGKAVAVQVLVDAAGAAALERQRAAITAKNRKPFFDFNHEDGPASFWPAEFRWKDAPEPGIYARGEWSASGKAGVEGREWRQFSPVFHVDSVRAKPARIICHEAARPNMGGLVNDPAFKNILPLWAKDAGAQTPGTDTNTNENTPKMTPEELAALQAKNKHLEQEIAALQAKEKKEADDEAALKAKQAELRASKAEEQVAALEAKNAALVAAEKTRVEKLADEAIAAAVAKGVLPPKDEALQAKWKAIIVANPENAALLASQAGRPELGSRMTQPPQRIEAGAARPGEVLKEFRRIMAQQAGADSIDKKALIARDASAFYAAEISGKPGILDAPLSAADSTDTNLGTLAGTLVSMRTLENYEAALVAPDFITTDYSDQPAQFGQTTTSRIVIMPAVQDYDATINADTGMANGWVAGTPAQTVDVPITINSHSGVLINFNTNQLSSTVRRLFDEQAEFAGYALAKKVNDTLLGLITAANFAGGAVGGNAPITAALASFNRATFAGAASTFNKAGVPIPRRCCLMNSDYFAQLSQDPTMVSLAVYQRPEVITDSQLTPLSRFLPLEASTLPGTGNLAAFFMHRSALMIQTRIPNDYTRILPGASFGNVSVITGKTGLSFLLVQYVNHDTGTALWRIALMYGVARGNPKGGLIVKSA